MNKKKKGTGIDSEFKSKPGFSGNPIIISFKYMDKNYYSVKNIPQSDWDIFFDFLYNISNMTWGQMEQDKHHFISLDSLNAEAYRNFQLFAARYSDNLFSFRIDGKKRLYGLVYESVFYILWYDREHKICPSKLKHT